MTTTYTCDGCGEVIGAGPVNEWFITVDVSSTHHAFGYTGATMDMFVPPPDVKPGHYHAECWPPAAGEHSDGV